MRALVIGHDHIGGTGHVGAVLAEAGWTLETFTVVPRDRYDRPDVHVAYPDPHDADLVVTLGAPWPRVAITTWTGTEVAFLADAHRRGVPVLGICAGAQFLAEALGGGSAPTGRERVGWREVRPVDERVPHGPWFQWHADRITLPSGAELLAESDDGPEAFRVGTSIGVQFHPEMTVELLDRWLAASPLERDRAMRLRAETARHTDGARARAEHLLGRLAIG